MKLDSMDCRAPSSPLGPPYTLPYTAQLLPVAIEGYPMLGGSRGNRIRTSSSNLHCFFVVVIRLQPSVRTVVLFNLNHLQRELQETLAAIQFT